jgi:wobble nucleotide-excising tRNase
LGDDAVAAKRKVDEITEEIRTLTDSIRVLNRELTAYASPLSAEQFRALPPIEDIPTKLAELDAKLLAARNNASLQARPVPDLLPVPSISLDSLNTIFDLEFQAVAADAEALVAEHLTRHPTPGVRTWIEQGLSHGTTEGCPFCGQNLDGVELIRAYRQAFSSEYDAAMTRVRSLPGIASALLAPLRYTQFQAKIQVNQERRRSWLPDLPLPDLELSQTDLESSLQRADSILQQLVQRKIDAPMERVDSEAVLGDLRERIDAVVRLITGYNEQASAIATSIQEFKSSLETFSATAIEDQIKTMRSTEKRYSDEVAELVARIEAVSSKKDAKDAEKVTARAAADSLMAATLSSYQAKINELLKKFGASFTIRELKPNYAGGSPRSDFGLELRSKPVALGSSSPGPSFRTTMSEADKRTLAFAFFLARLDSDPTLPGKIVVLDDPMSSMDLARRHESIRQSCSLASRCVQLIVLSHDPHFLRKLRKELARQQSSPYLEAVKIQRSQGGYSVFGATDLDDECASSYTRHHRMVQSYVDGTYPGDLRNVAKAIRPMLEGYLHRRFPGLIDSSLLFGQIIQRSGEDPASPLYHLQQHVSEYNAVNFYVGDFHHDTNQSADSVQIADAELRSYAIRALALIQQNG